MGKSITMLCTAAVVAVAGIAATAPASAGGRLKERVYDDSFGNLVIVSPSGSKRIVVGKGHIAAEMEAERSAALADAYQPAGPRRAYFPQVARCHQPPVLWKGRSYMYGLPDGEVPTPPVICD